MKGTKMPKFPDRIWAGHNGLYSIIQLIKKPILDIPADVEYIRADLVDKKMLKKNNKPKIDPVCLVHGKKLSEHDCLYCCLCFKPLTPEQCHILPNGKKENVCIPCAAQEEILLDKQS